MLSLSHTPHSAQLRQPPSPCLHPHSTHCTSQHGPGLLWCGALGWWGPGVGGGESCIIPVSGHQMGLWLHSPGAEPSGLVSPAPGLRALLRVCSSSVFPSFCPRPSVSLTSQQLHCHSAESGGHCRYRLPFCIWGSNSFVSEDHL